ncbi:MAG: aminotransferase class I/II-fold pyridoxal phosphate-dependent enzyme [Phycisphaerales bacterium]|nr:aminotransferase class I/II-fold pyridoxal phosphate-dependent enzyme [Phycisphaerales bacterium]
MTSTHTSGQAVFEQRTRAVLDELESNGQYKHLQMIEGPMGPSIDIRGMGTVDCFCSNNYLGLANHPEVVDAGIEALKKWGAGTASVRFICGTFTAHEQLENQIASFLGVEASYTFVSCWTATEAFFATVCEPGDVIVSDALNHACIIDAMRLTTVIKKGVHKAVYKHSDMEHCREVLVKARETAGDTGVIWLVTDGVFSMEGDLGNLPGLRKLCDEFGALLVVDDSHGTGVMGETGRGTHEYWDMDPSQIDVFTGTLGKALGGGAGGYLAGTKTAMEMIVQRARPTLFSNALPCTVAASATKAIQVVDREPERVAKLRNNVERARAGIRDAGFEVLDSPTAICPIIVHDTARAIAMSKRLLELGSFAIGFGYPVVPEGEARIRVQISAAHEDEHIDRLVKNLVQLKSEFVDRPNAAS